MPPKKSSKPYKMPPPLPKNEVLTDTMKKKWTIGPSIGKGGFGEIYAAAEGEVTKKDSEYCYVIKIEPHENGPLFVERNFYMRAAKAEDVLAWTKSRKLKTFGMPVMYGSGSHECGGTKYRFLVMDRFSKDLWSVFIANNKTFPIATVLQVASQVLHVLEYIHSKGYVHADIKGANLLLGWKKGSENQVYVVDFGLASRYATTEFKRDPKKAHNGTIEYTSRDAHAGVSTRRGDLEILAFNVVHWLTSKLPWEDKIKDPAVVEKSKQSAMENVPTFLKTCFGKKKIPGAVSKFVKYVSELSCNEAPDYEKVQKMFVDGLKEENVKLGAPLIFSKPIEHQNGSVKTTKTAKVRTSPRKATKVLPRNEASSSKTNGSEIENLDSDEEMFFSFTESDQEKDSAKKRKVECPKPVEKVSWRDCPTAKTSRITKAGEYIPLNPKRPKKEK